MEESDVQQYKEKLLKCGEDGLNALCNFISAGGGEQNRNFTPVIRTLKIGEGSEYSFCKCTVGARTGCHESGQPSMSMSLIETAIVKSDFVMKNDDKTVERNAVARRMILRILDNVVPELVLNDYRKIMKIYQSMHTEFNTEVYKIYVKTSEEYRTEATKKILKREPTPSSSTIKTPKFETKSWADIVEGEK